jgi:ATP-dependent Lon protease
MQLEKTPPQAEGETTAPTAAIDGASAAPAIPDDALIIVPVRNMVLFPGMILPVTIGRDSSIAGAQQAVKAERPIGIVLQRDPEIDRPALADLCPVGTLANVLRYVTTPDGTHHVICQGQQRVRLVELIEGYPYMVARVDRIEEPDGTGKEIEARFMQLKERSLEVLQLMPQASQELLGAVQT